MGKKGWRKERERERGGIKGSFLGFRKKVFVTFAFLIHCHWSVCVCLLSRSFTCGYFHSGFIWRVWGIGDVRLLLWQPLGGSTGVCVCVCEWKHQLVTLVAFYEKDCQSFDFHKGFLWYLSTHRWVWPDLTFSPFCALLQSHHFTHQTVAEKKRKLSVAPGSHEGVVAQSVHLRQSERTRLSPSPDKGNEVCLPLLVGRVITERWTAHKRGLIP